MVSTTLINETTQKQHEQKGEDKHKQQQQEPQQSMIHKDNDAENQNEEDDNSRIIFYFSFRNPQIAYPGNPASIRDEIGKSQVTLDELQVYLLDAISTNVDCGSNSILPPSNNDVLQNPFPWNR